MGSNHFVFDDGPTCERPRDVGTDHGIPQDAEQIRFVYEIYSSCDAFGIPPTDCTGETNFTPILDNVVIGFTRALDPTDVPDRGPWDSEGAVARTQLRTAWPNPSTRSVQIRYELGRTGPATIAIFDAAGRRVRVLFSGPQRSGAHEIVWDGRDDRGTPLPAGTYWSRLEAPEYVGSRRIVVLR